MSISDLDPGVVALAGDWHGRLGFASDAIRAACEHGAEAIVHLGDFGYLFEPSYLHGLDAVLEGIPLFFIDGNHEDFAYLESKPLAEDGTRPLSRHVLHLPRGLRWTWRGRSWLALGGAHSVDRMSREPGVSWWPQERLTEEDVRRVSEPGHADVLVCHDPPAGVDAPKGYGDARFPLVDEELGERHRGLVRRVVDAATPRLIAHGHFHARYRSTLGGATVLGLAHDGTSVAENLAWLDAERLELLPPTAELREIPPMTEAQPPQHGTEPAEDPASS
ncbi:hypothetical protein USB125703_01326 [Pseudoclavibacter triregionum]|nr:hypothetical protein USB125703_01326 [Pseudoclavibacter triregionum]